MKIIKRILQVILVLVLIAVMIGCALIRNASRKSLPDYNTNIILTGLDNEVQVYRDKYAIPHVYAATENDLYLATGYLIAQDRLWQMDLLRRVTLGRLSEIFGESFVGTDLLLRALRFSEKSKEILSGIDERQLSALESFSSGINQYINANIKKLPFEFKLLGYKPDPWEPVHTMNLIGYMAWDLKSGWNELILEDIKTKTDSVRYKELLPDYSNYKPVVYPEFNAQEAIADASSKLYLAAEQLENLGADVFSGSNNWAVSGEKSATGLPILANDMHLGFGIPGIWYQMHQVVENELNVTGLMLPGAPFIICGHNEYIAWGMTNTYVDNLDFYLEKINPEDSNKYEFNGEWKEIVTRKEIIKTKKEKEIAKEIRFTDHGPVISGFKGIDNKVITMHWVGDEPSNEMRTVYLLNRASNWEEFKEAIKTFKSISQNIVYADVNGNIGLYCAAGVPVRKRSDVFPLLPGWTDEYDWKGMLDFEKLPYSYNPENGFVCSANNKTTGNGYPYHIGSWYALPYRMDRIREVLSAKEIITIDDYKMLQLDHRSELAEKHVPLLISALNSDSDKSGTEAECFEILKKWDYTYDIEDIAPTIFETYYDMLMKNIFSDELEEDLFNMLLRIRRTMDHAIYRIAESKKSEWLDDVNTEDIKESFDDIARKSFYDAVSYLEQSYKADIKSWKWGDIHLLTLEHPLGKVRLINKIFRLNRGPFNVGGSFHTVSPYGYPYGSPDKVIHGASHRHIYTTENWDNSLSIIPTGNSGIPASNNYCDQTEMYIKGEYHGDYFSGELVKKNTKYKMSFVPGD